MCAVAQQPYWICVDDQGRRTVQDAACREAPDAPPTGVARPALSVPAVGGSPAAPAKAASAPARRDVDPETWWAVQFQRWAGPLAEPDAWKRGALHPALHIGLGVVAVLLLGAWLLRRVLPRLRRQRELQAAQSQPDPYRQAVQNLTVEPSPTAPRSAALSVEDDRPLTWTPERIERLRPEAFARLCLRLCQLRGHRAQAVSEDVILLRQASAPEVLHGVVLCRSADAGPGAVRELFGLMQHHGCPYGAVMSAADFGIQAREFARGKNVELKGRTTLMTEIEALGDAQRSTLLAEVLRKPRPA